MRRQGGAGPARWGGGSLTPGRQPIREGERRGGAWSQPQPNPRPPAPPCPWPSAAARTTRPPTGWTRASSTTAASWTRSTWCRMSSCSSSLSPSSSSVSFRAGSRSGGEGRGTEGGGGSARRAARPPPRVPCSVYYPVVPSLPGVPLNPQQTADAPDLWFPQVLPSQGPAGMEKGESRGFCTPWKGREGSGCTLCGAA